MAHAGGRPRRFASPEELYAAFEEYREWASANPWIKKDFVRGGEFAGQLVDLPTERPLTEWEFAVFCGMSRRGLQEYCDRDEYSRTYSRIKDEMSAQRVSGGLTGAFNANLVARIDGIKDRAEIDAKFEPLVLLTEDGKKLLELGQGRAEDGTEAS